MCWVPAERAGVNLLVLTAGWLVCMSSTQYGSCMCGLLRVSIWWNWCIDIQVGHGRQAP